MINDNEDKSNKVVKPRNKPAIALAICIILVAVGIVGIVLALINVIKGYNMQLIIVVVGAGLLVVGAIGIAVAEIYVKKHYAKVAEAQSAKEENDRIALGIEDGKYIEPRKNEFKTIHLGDHQTAEQKFDQIAQMDKMQFVVYIVKLFKRKGYNVKFTPVVDNFGVDFVAELNNQSTAVTCALSDKLVDVKCLQILNEARGHYTVDGAMVVTNTYFARVSVEYAKAHYISLIDRTTLTDEFIM